MARRRLICHEESFGIYEAWDSDQPHVPQVREFTDCIPAQPGLEFGYVLRITGGKGALLHWRIDHPPFTDSHGHRVPAFTGTEYVRGNDYAFFLGDALWEPWQDMVGQWVLTTVHKDKELAMRRFQMVAA